MLRKVVVLMCLVTTAWSYKSGPPESTCESMMPNHDAEPKDPATTIFELRTDACYNENVTLNVHIKVKEEEGDDNFFEGFLLEARKTDGSTTAYGTFSIENDSDLKTLDCGSGTANAIGHGKAAHYLNKVVKWTPPAGNEDLKFVATIVRHKPEIWMNHEAMITYSADCSPTVPSDPYITGGSTAVTGGVTLAVLTTILTHYLH